MALESFRGLLSGPVLGPVGPKLPGTPSGRWVHIYREPTPLLWGVNKWLWFDDPEHLGGGGGGVDFPPDPGGGGGGSSGGGGIRFPRDPRLGQDGPEWILEDPGPAPGPPTKATCDERQRLRIEAAYWRVLASPEWQAIFAKFAGLSDCIRFSWDHVKIQCNHSSLLQHPHLNFADRPDILTFSDVDVDAATDDWLEVRMVQQLVRFCGGTILDAYAIAQMRGDFLFVEFNRKSNLELLMNSAKSDNGSGHQYYIGTWVYWDPATGEIYFLNPFGQRLIPNPSLPKPVQNRIRGWYRLP